MFSSSIALNHGSSMKTLPVSNLTCLSKLPTYRLPNRTEIPPFITLRRQQECKWQRRSRHCPHLHFPTPTWHLSPEGPAEQTPAREGSTTLRGVNRVSADASLRPLVEIFYLVLRREVVSSPSVSLCSKLVTLSTLNSAFI